MASVDAAFDDRFQFTLRAEVKSPLANGIRLAPPARPGFGPGNSSLSHLPRDTPNATPAIAPSALRRRIADFWLRVFFFTSEHANWLARAATGVVRCGVYRASPAVRKATLANAARILGPQSSHADRKRVAKGVIASFYRFCIDVAQSANRTPEDLLTEIAAVEGREHYDRARASGKGLIIATAHMGSFEVGLAGLAMQGQKLHVIFQRDEHGLFERQRSGLRKRLNVVESPVDDGWTMWIRLRDALLAGEAVVLQADRVMPGQKGQKMPFLHGHMDMPAGPAKLARLSGAWIVPIFSVRQADGKVRLFIEPPITPADDICTGAVGPNGRAIDPLLLKLAGVLEKYVRAYPDQWLMFHPAFCEDQQPTPPPDLLKDAPRA